jgi:triosephosphate isomerase
MKKRILVFNWKMNPADIKSAQVLFHFISKYAKKSLIVAPPFVYLPLLSGLKSKLHTKNVFLAAQDSFIGSSGAFTGAISPVMLSEFGVSYAIVGHSERRYVFGEDDKLIHAKVAGLQEFGITPILCVGERKRTSFEVSWKTVKSQLDKDLGHAGKNNLIIAYEPVWSIGGNKPTNAEHSLRMIVRIKSYLSSRYKNLPVLYGGSVDCKNIGEFLQYKEIDGYLVGSASLKKEQLSCLINKVI